MVRPVKSNELVLPEIPEDEPEVPNSTPSNADLEALKRILATPEGQAAVRGAAAPPPPTFSRDYKRDPNIRVTGGLEVDHGANFLPKPPAYISMYVGKSGEDTDYLEPYYIRQKRLVPRKEDGKVVLTADGNPVADEVFTDVMVDPGAKIENGKPVLTAGYRTWLQAWIQGKSLTGNVRSDIATGNYVDEGVDV